MSNDITLAAGTVVEFSTNLTTPVYTVAPYITSVGAIGLMSEAKERTTLSDTQKKYGAGLQDAPDKTIKGQFVAGDADQQSFITACKAKTPMLIKITLPNSVTPVTGVGTQLEYEFKPLGFEFDEPTAEEWLMWTVNGKQNSEVAETQPT